MVRQFGVFVDLLVRGVGNWVGNWGMSTRFCLLSVNLTLPLHSLLVFAITSVVAVSTASGRMWTSGDGAYSIEAELVGSNEEAVFLRKADGRVIAVPLARLSAEDRAYVAQGASGGASSARAASDAPSAGGVSPAASAADSPPTGIRTYAELVRAASGLREAADVLRLYKRFLQDRTIGETDREAARKQLPVWEDRASRDMVRGTTRWLPRSEAANERLQARQLVYEAIKLIEAGQDQAAAEKCAKASKLDEQDILADFILGLGYALRWRDAEKANRHFSACLGRDPQHVCALNNLALTEIRLKKYGRALGHWQEAMEQAPAAPAVVANLGRLLRLAERGTVRVPRSAKRRCGDLYTAVVGTPGKQDFRGADGWLYLGYYAPLGLQPLDDAKPGQDQDQDGRQEAEGLITVAFGTGFVVYPGYVLTNRRVAKAGASVSVVSEGGKGDMPANVVAVAENEDDDLAVIRCEGLAAPPIPFIKPELAALGTEISVLKLLGTSPGSAPSLKSALGIIAGLPDSLYSRYTLDASTSGAGSGGLICDATGSVLGILPAPTGHEASAATGSTVGIPHSRALPLLQKIPGYRPPPPLTQIRPWPEVEEAVRRSTVLIWVKMPVCYTSVFGMEDSFCMRCYGRGRIDCPRCLHGKVSVTKVEVLPNVPGAPPHVVRSTVHVPCRHCHGSGTLPCPDCR